MAGVLTCRSSSQMPQPPATGRAVASVQNRFAFQLLMRPPNPDKRGLKIVEAVDHLRGPRTGQRFRPVVAPGHAYGGNAGGAGHLDIIGRVAQHDRARRFHPGFGQSRQQHRGMRLRRVIVGDLAGREVTLQPVRLKDMRKPAPGFSGRDPKLEPVAGVQSVQCRRRAGIKRRKRARPKVPERLLVGLNRDIAN